MKKILGFILTLLLIFLNSTPLSHAETPSFKLGNEVLMTKFQSLLKGKRIGLITNQSGVDSQGRSIINLLAKNKNSKLVALYGPEHGIDGKAKAGEYVKSYTHPTLKYLFTAYTAKPGCLPLICLKMWTCLSLMCKILALERILTCLP